MADLPASTMSDEYLRQRALSPEGRECLRESLKRLREMIALAQHEAARVEAELAKHGELVA